MTLAEGTSATVARSRSRTRRSPSARVDLLTEASHALHLLGSTGDQVAWSLLARDITGRPNRAGTCPIARYLDSVTGRTWVVSWERMTALTIPNRPGVTMVTPVAVSDFIRDFDHGQYPILIDTQQKETPNE